MVERSDSEPTSTKNRTTVERASERELVVTRTSGAAMIRRREAAVIQVL